MSWQIFKDNIVRMSDNPDAIPDIDTVAKTYAREYDAAIKRGKDTIEGVSLQKGNVEIMESIFKAALQKGLTSTTPYDLVGEMGKGVLAYWGGAIMNNFPNPKTLPPGAVSNISVTSNVVMDPGQWNPPVVQAANSRILPDDEMTDPSNIGDDNAAVEGQFVLDAIGPSDGSNLLLMESRQPKDINETEATLITNPEEVVIVDNVPTESDEAAVDIQRPNEGNNKNNNWDDGSRTPVRIYKNVGIDPYPVPPGYEKYSIKRTTEHGGKVDGPGGNVPIEALGKLSQSGHYAHPEAAKFMNLLLAAAKRDGVTVNITSSYRDYATGVRLYNENVAKGTPKNAAHPGYSAHGFGGAVDIGCLWQAQTDAAAKFGVKKTAGDTAAGYVRAHHPTYAWLAANGPKYGWYNPARLNAGMGTQEAWHWEYWGFNTLTKEQRGASGATSVPTGGNTTKTTNTTTQSNGTYSAILVAGLNYREGDKSTAEQVSLLQSGLGSKKVKGFDWNAETATILSFLKSNPGLPVFLFSAGCKQAGYISDSTYVNKDKLYVIEPYHSGGETSKSVQKAVKDGVPANHIFVGPNSSRGLGVVSGASSSNADTHWNALVSVSGKVKQLI